MSVWYAGDAGIELLITVPCGATAPADILTARLMVTDKGRSVSRELAVTIPTRTATSLVVRHVTTSSSFPYAGVHRYRVSLYLAGAVLAFPTLESAFPEVEPKLVADPT